jgi:hypothetical protein
MKQDALHQILKKNKLSIIEYNSLYLMHKLKRKLPQELFDKYILKNPSFLDYLNREREISDKGIRLLKSIDELFKPIKKLKNFELLGDNYAEHVQNYIQLFPKGKLPSGQYARGNQKNIVDNFMWFFQEYNYTWETILEATKIYIEEYEKENYKYMRTAMYFIKKLTDGTTNSQLANYCDLVESGGIVQDKTFKRKVV